MGKKTIAVIVGTNEVFFRTHALDGIVNQAKALGYNVAVLFAFSSLLSSAHFTHYDVIYREPKHFLKT